MSEASLLSEKLHRYGVLGAGVIPDSLATVRFAQAREATVAADSGAGVALAPFRAETAVIARHVGEDGTLTREEILSILEETVRVQGIVQQEVSVLARKLAKEKVDKKSKKKKELSFIDGHKKILELNLPREPLEDYGLSEHAFQKILLQYEEDDEVMGSAQKLLHPVGKGDPERARGITMDKIIEIHQFMVQEMQKVLKEFLQHPQEVRRSFTGKGCETTAELLVSIAVEQQLSVRCEDVEQAVIRYEDALQGHPDFTRCTEQLASMMQHLIGAAQPRIHKDEFVKILMHMGDSTRKAKAFAKKLYEDYRAKTCDIVEAYQRFEAYTEESARGPDGEEPPDLSSVEMQLCYDEYRGDATVMQAWEQSGVENNLMMQSMMSGTSPASSSSPTREDKKIKKVKASEIVEMQELMVDELKRTTEASLLSLRGGTNGKHAWKAEVAIQMVQALASAAVERRYGTSAEEMTMAGFNHAATLQKNERFVRATEKQQEILMTVAKLCRKEE